MTAKVSKQFDCVRKRGKRGGMCWAWAKYININACRAGEQLLCGIFLFFERRHGEGRRRRGQFNWRHNAAYRWRFKWYMVHNSSSARWGMPMPFENGCGSRFFFFFRLDESLLKCESLKVSLLQNSAQNEKRGPISSQSDGHRSPSSRQIRLNSNNQFDPLLYDCVIIAIFIVSTQTALTVRYLTRRYIGEYKSHTGNRKFETLRVVMCW